MNSGEQKALRLFHNAARRVPAYKDFLKQARINPDKIKTIKDFANVPVTDAKNYIAAYPIEKRCWDGKLSATKIIAASSGTTGEPKFWPRSAEQDMEAAEVHQWLYEAYFEVHKRSTLVLIGFPMGVYVSGMATVLPSWLVAQKNPHITLMSIGNNKTEMLRAVRNLSGAYEQTILIGHPFFIKDVIETGVDEGISWRHNNIGMMFCSEGFTEEWREYLREKAAIPRGTMRIFNTYGSSEMLLMGYESPLSIDLRKSWRNHKEIPNIFQYNPRYRFIETQDTELLFTSVSGIPLIRFNLKDKGEVIPFASAKHILKKNDKKSSWWGLPFLTLVGRSDQTMIFYAANIYPEHIKAGLSSPIFFKLLTGKFTLRKEYLRNMDEFLEVNIEMKPRIKPTHGLETSLRKNIVNRLEKINMEYKFLRGNLHKDIVPRVKLWPYGHKKYFKPGLKPKYIAE